MSKEIENIAIGGLKELYVECAKLIHSIYNDGMMNETTVVEYSEDGVQRIGVVDWFVSRQFELSLLYNGRVTIKNARDCFEGLYFDSASSLYEEIRGNIERLWNCKDILQGYIKGLLSLIGWDGLVRENDALMDWLCNIGKEEDNYNREIFVFWKRFVDCKKHLDCNIKSLLVEYGLLDEVVRGEPQQVEKKKDCTVAKSNRPKGKPNKTFKDRLMDGVEGKRLKKLHSLIDGRIGKDVALVILMATEKGWMINKPTFTQVSEEFGYIGNSSGYYKYMKPECYSDVEKKGVLSLLEE